MSFVIFAMGCSNAPGGLDVLYNHVRRQQYIPFQVVQDLKGVGTIIKYPRSAEEESPKDPEVIRLGKSWLPASIIREGVTKISDLSTDVNLDIDTAMNFAGLPVSGALNASQVQNVVLKFGKMKQELLEIGILEDTLRSGTVDEGALEDASTPGNYIITEALVAEKMTFGFIDKSGAEIQLDASRFGAHLKSSYDIENKTNLVVNKPVYIGYKVIPCKATKKGVLLKSFESPKAIETEKISEERGPENTTQKEKKPKNHVEPDSLFSLVSTVQIVLSDFGSLDHISSVKDAIESMPGCEILYSEPKDKGHTIKLRTEKMPQEIKKHIQTNSSGLDLHIEISGSTINISPNVW